MLLCVVSFLKVFVVCFYIRTTVTAVWHGGRRTEDGGRRTIKVLTDPATLQGLARVTDFYKIFLIFKKIFVGCLRFASVCRPKIDNERVP